MTRKAVLYYTTLDTPIGLLTLVSTKNGLCRIDFQNNEGTLQNIERWARRSLMIQNLEEDEAPFIELKNQIKAYFKGEQTTFDCQLDLIGTPFQKLVWNELLNIPYGECRSYKQVAQAIGAPKAVRAIGGANNRNAIPIIIPCHRVIGTNGALVGYGGGLHIKEQLLSLEGIHLNLYRKKA